MTQAAAFSPSIRLDQGIIENSRQQRFPKEGDVDALKKWQRSARRKLKQLIGLPTNDHAPTQSRVLWRREHELGVIEKIEFQAEPGATVPAYFCKPHGAGERVPTVICLQGHSSGMHNSIAIDFETESKPIAVKGDRDFGLTAMANGYAALCIEQRCFGERREQHRHLFAEITCHDPSMRALMLGRTMIGERVFDVDRSIDYLKERGDVDMSRVGVMGNSGGGTISVFAGAVLPRLSMMMPSCYVCRFAESLMKIAHCTCNFVPGLLEHFECADVLACFAPKPLVVVAGKTDSLFPIKHVRGTMREVREVYKTFGASDRLRFIEGQEGHRFYAEPAWRAVKKVWG